MIEFIINHKWYFFIIGEVIFWSSLIGFLLLRYAFDLKQLSKYAIVIWLASDLWLLTIGILDYTQTGTFDRFQIIILIFLIYAFTFGKNDFKRLDGWIKKAVARWKCGTPPQNDAGSDGRLYGTAHAKSERRKFYVHLIIYIAAHAGFILFQGYDVTSVAELVNNLDAANDGGSPDGETELISSISGISAIWTFILLIDFIWSFSYTLWPKKDKRG